MPLNIPQLPASSSPADWRQNIYKKSLQDNLLQSSYKRMWICFQDKLVSNIYVIIISFAVTGDQYEKEATPQISEEEYEELLERLRVADFLYTEYSLEEIIYQLAKVNFKISIQKVRNINKLLWRRWCFRNLWHEALTKLNWLCKSSQTSWKWKQNKDVYRDHWKKKF